jgi:drug/metabolite transporter (DMT)-like permease
MRVSAAGAPETQKGDHTSMWTMLWPLLLIIGSNAVYHVIAKSTPDNVNTFLSLTVTYLVAAAAALAMFFATSGGHTIGECAGKLNWTSLALGLAVIGLETGSLYLYRAGWAISIGSLIANIALAVVLVVIGLLFYHETLSIWQVGGILCCAVGLLLLNKR